MSTQSKKTVKSVGVNLKVNSFATIISFREYNKVRFYTVIIDGNPNSEVVEFLLEASTWTDPNVIKRFERLKFWIKKIGNDIGADFDLFREEKCNSKALPPKSKHDPTYAVKTGKNVRLYCHWVSEEVVILYGGGLKTKNNPQECPNVKEHFYNAAYWSSQLNQIEMKVKGKEIEGVEKIKLKC